MKLQLKNIKIGDKLRLTVDTYLQNGYSKGDIVKVVLKQGAYIYIIKDGSMQIGVMLTALEPAIFTKELLNENLSKLKEEIKDYEDKLTWMEETGNDTYDEVEVKVWKTLKTLNSKSTDLEKAKIIAKLING